MRIMQEEIDVIKKAIFNYFFVCGRCQLRSAKPKQQKFSIHEHKFQIVFTYSKREIIVILWKNILIFVTWNRTPFFLRSRPRAEVFEKLFQKKSERKCNIFRFRD